MAIAGSVSDAEVEKMSRHAPTSVSQLELLEIVRKHLAGYNRAMIGSSSVDDMDESYWKELMDLFFIRGGGGDSSSELNSQSIFDDMLFFVRKTGTFRGRIQSLANSISSAIGQGSKKSTDEQDKNKPYFVRRWANQLERVLGTGSADDVDWRKSFLLNLICHSNYSLTVAICSRKSLEEYRKTSCKSKITVFKKVTKRVFASPNRLQIDVDTAKASESLSSFPDINFTVDDYDNAFSNIVLTDADHCLSVVLNANGGAAFPLEEWVAGRAADGSLGDSQGGRTAGRRTSSEARALGDVPSDDNSPVVTLFSGFVTYALVRNHLIARNFETLSVLTPNRNGKIEKLILNGPHGRGFAEVAVSDLPLSYVDTKPEPELVSLSELQSKLLTVQSSLSHLVDEQQELFRQCPQMSDEERQRQDGIYRRKLGTLHGELATLQSKLAGRETEEDVPVAADDRTSVRGLIGEYLSLAVMDVTGQKVKVQPMRCCVMTLSIPWHSLAYDLLFKELPLKVDITGHVLPPARHRLTFDW